MGLRWKKKQEAGENYDLYCSENSIRMIKLRENGTEEAYGKYRWQQSFRQDFDVES